MSNDTTAAVHGNKPTKNARRYPPLLWGSDFEAWLEVRDVYDVVAAFRAYVDADRAARTQSEVAEPVAYRLLRKNSAGEWVRDFNDWCDGAPSQELVNEVMAQPDHWRIEWAFGTPSSVDQTAQDDARQVDAIRQVIRDYRRGRWTQRQYGVAEGAALSAIEKVLGTGLKQGAEAADRATDCRTAEGC